MTTGETALDSGAAAAAPGSRACRRCGRSYALWGLEVTCSCGGPLEWLRGELRDQEPGAGVWRFASLLPPVSPAHRLTLGEAETPLLAVERLVCKLDYLMPTGSFKDRGAAVLASCALEAGATSAVADSSGNAGAALAAYFASAGIRLTVFVAAGSASPKVGQSKRYGATVIEVEGERSAASRAAVELASRSGAFYASHAWSPYFTAGTRTLAFELHDQLGGDIPAVVTPVGAGTALLGLHQGFSELVERGELASVPPIIGVQAAPCAPLADAFEHGFDVPDPDRRWGRTVAGGINIAEPPRGAEVLEAVRGSKGAIVTVDDEAILAAQKQLDRRGILVEATSAATWAAANGSAGAPDGAVVILTGSGMKEAL